MDQKAETDRAAAGCGAAKPHGIYLDAGAVAASSSKTESNGKGIERP